ncbi:shikimate O-hydroxycinnamoyltransferase [Salvia divinorum]|uniref:Shikimate O-hydroxycinnamoyltransferase n=1 Tax=Salvia divinorum TaxID=28513 RepID=A0ABD1GMA0_SALDI
MKVNKIMSKLIKPETPTPEKLKIYNISFIDQFKGPLNVAIILFYESNPETTIDLQESLAKILVQFYPLAGRFIKNDNLVNCSDQGVEFIETEALGVELAEVVSKTDTGQLNDLLPEHYFRLDESPDSPILSIEVTRFPSGGAVISISVSHRVFDASSLGTFVAAWSAATNPDRTVQMINPTFDIPSMLPNKDLGHGPGPVQSNNRDDEIAVKRFRFNNEAITAMTTRISPVKTVSGVRVVCAVIAKALIRLDRVRHGRDRDFVITQPVNMRGRTVPPQPRHACGNFFISALTRRVAAEAVGVKELVDLIGDSVRRCVGDYGEVLCRDQDGRGMILSGIGNYTEAVFNGETNVVAFSDWSRFGFYEADFGWGKLALASIGPQRLPPMFSNIVVLMSDSEGVGIEAWVMLSQNDMLCFQQDEDIRLFQLARNSA